MKWRTDLLAWANDAGVKVHDMKTDKGIAFIERPKGIPQPEFLLPHLVWQVNCFVVHTNDVKGSRTMYISAVTFQFDQYISKLLLKGHKSKRFL
jgi:hypothetical protein